VELKTPLEPAPPAAPEIVHETCEAGIEVPAGPFKLMEAARTLIRSALPELSAAFKKLTALGFEVAAVLELTLPT
jgi:hypothetical protein